MTATPPRADLRTLAAEPFWAVALPALSANADPRLLDLLAHALEAGVAAVLPEHRRMVLAEAADALDAFPLTGASTKYGQTARRWFDRAAETIRLLAAAAPPDGLSAPVPAGNAPAVPEEVKRRQRASESVDNWRASEEALDTLTAEMESERDRLARELHEAQTELALVKSKPLFSTRKVMQTLLEALGDPVDEQELILRIDDGLRLADVAQRVIAALALTAAERDVVDAAKAWRAMRSGTPTQPKPESFALIAAVDALPDAGTDQTEDGHGRPDRRPA